jgi:hypothetical protein
VTDGVGAQVHALTFHPQRGQHEKRDHLTRGRCFFAVHLEKQPVDRDEDQRREQIEYVPVFEQGIRRELVAEEGRGDDENCKEYGEYQCETSKALHYDRPSTNAKIRVGVCDSRRGSNLTIKKKKLNHNPAKNAGQADTKSTKEYKDFALRRISKRFVGLRVLCVLRG